MVAGRRGEDMVGGRASAEEEPCVFGDKMRLDTRGSVHRVLRRVQDEGQAGRQRSRVHRSGKKDKRSR